MLAGWGRFVHRFRFAVIALSLASVIPSLWLIAHGGRLATTDVPTTTESGRALDLIGRELPGRPPPSASSSAAPRSRRRIPHSGGRSSGRSRRCGATSGWPGW